MSLNLNNLHNRIGESGSFNSQKDRSERLQNMRISQLQYGMDDQNSPTLAPDELGGDSNRRMSDNFNNSNGFGQTSSNDDLASANFGQPMGSANSNNSTGVQQYLQQQQKIPPSVSQDPYHYLHWR